MRKLWIVILTLIMVVGMMSAIAMAEESVDPSADPEVTVYLTRHGKTLFNAVHRIQGWCDSPLTEDGIEVVEDLGIGLKESGITFDAAYSSDLGRQRDTARIVLDELGLTDMEVRENRGLREECYGSWEGELESVRDETFCEITGAESIYEIYPDQPKLFDLYVTTDETGMAESHETATTRFVAALTEIVEEAKANEYSNVLVVSSGAIINTLLTYLDAPGGELENASVTMLYYNEGEFTLGEIGDTSYTELGAEIRGE